MKTPPQETVLQLTLGKIQSEKSGKKLVVVREVMETEK
jgi:hypothetical protein